MAREEKRARKAAAAPPAGPPAPRWPVWTAVALTLLYFAVHASMIPVALRLWRGLAGALLLGQ